LARAWQEFAFQEIRSDPGLVFEPPGSQHIHVGSSLRGVGQASDGDNPLLRQLRDDIVGLSQADPHPSGKLSLGQVGLIGHDLEELVTDFVFVDVVQARNVYLRRWEMSRGYFWHGFHG